MLGFCISDVLALLGKVAHDRLVGVGTVLDRIGVGEALKGVAVAGFDGVQPGLFDRKVETGVVKPTKAPMLGRSRLRGSKGVPEARAARATVWAAP